MIHVFFVPGMFGSTIEYVLRNFTSEFDSIDAQILSDGSMHSFKKNSHWLSIKEIESAYRNCQTTRDISTPIYPFENHHFPDILKTFLSFADPNDKKILIYARDIESAELNMLFQYHKIAFGTSSKLGLSIFFDQLEKSFTNWNPLYTSWNDMKHWEIREWFSLFYPVWIQEWINSVDQVDGTFLKISNDQILDCPEQSFQQILEYCNLTVVPGLDTFAKKWSSSQQYIVDEYTLTLKIVDSIMLSKPLEWENLSLVAEAIVQQRLRTLGYEIRCDGLNTFPTDSKTLYNLLEKV